jgi:hypothetical protein
LMELKLLLIFVEEKRITFLDLWWFYDRFKLIRKTHKFHNIKILPLDDVFRILDSYEFYSLLHVYRERRYAL